MPMNSHLEQLRQAIGGAIDGLAPEDFTRHRHGKWCVNEILEHLFLTYTGTIKGLERCLKEGKPLARRPEIRDRIRALVVVGLGYFPEGRKAPERTVPRGTPDVVAQIAPRIDDMAALFDECGARFGSRTLLMDHPILGPLTVDGWCKFHWVHGRHHVRQILVLRGK